jgi:hypothetical protein
MKPGGLVRIVSIALLLVVTSPLLMADPAPKSAMLFATGPVRVNGLGSARTSAVFGGDAIATDASATGTISSLGSVVMVPPNSLVVFQGNDIVLNTGFAVVSTTRGMRAQVGNYAVAPAQNGNGRFEVMRAGSFVHIRAARGPVTITGGGENRVLAEGASISFGKEDEGAFAMNASQEQIPGGPPPTAERRKRSGAAVWWLGGGAASGAGAAAFFVGHPHVSPVVP